MTILANFMCSWLFGYSSEIIIAPVFVFFFFLYHSRISNIFASSSGFFVERIKKKKLGESRERDERNGNSG